MKAILAFSAALLLAAPAASQDPQPLSLEHKMLLRCSAAFAMIATRQAFEEADALRYPVQEERYKDYYLHATARVMDEAHLDRDAIRAALLAQAQELAQEGQLDAVMPGCLLALEASGR